MNLAGKVVVITGGVGQVGYAVAKNLANKGATVVAVVRKDLNTAQLKMSALNSNSYAILADVRDFKSLEEASKKVSHCDILINAAGFTRSIDPKNMQELTEEIGRAHV